MLDAASVAAYRRDGYVVLPEWLGRDLTREIQDAVAAMLARAHGMSKADEVYDLESWPLPSKAAPCSLWKTPKRRSA